MAHETPTISAARRDRIGSRYAQRLRREGRLPAVIYGHQTDPVAVSVDEKEMIELLKHGAHLLSVAIDGAGEETCLVKELQFGYLGDNVIHIDLARVDLDEVVEVSVHLHFTGEPEAARKPGAVLTHNLTQLQVACKANAIPDEIRVDLSGMTEGLSVRDLVLPAGVTAKTDPDTMVAQITQVHVEEPAGEEAAVAAPATPEVIGEKKDQEAG